MELRENRRVDGLPDENVNTTRRGRTNVGNFTIISPGISNTGKGKWGSVGFSYSFRVVFRFQFNQKMISL